MSTNPLLNTATATIRRPPRRVPIATRCWRSRSRSARRTAARPTPWRHGDLHGGRDECGDRRTRVTSPSTTRCLPAILSANATCVAPERRRAARSPARPANQFRHDGRDDRGRRRQHADVYRAGEIRVQHGDPLVNTATPTDPASLPANGTDSDARRAGAPRRPRRTAARITRRAARRPTR